jgi:hypothetical protein
VVRTGWDHTPDSVRLNHGPYRSRDAGQTAAICLTLGFRVAAPDLPGITRPHRRRCDETEVSIGGRRTTPQPTRLAPGRTLAQPAVLPRPLVGSYPTGSPLTGAYRALAGMLSVAVVVRTRLSPACPHLLFRGATLFRTRPSELDTGWRTGSREVPLDSNLLSSDGSPIGPRKIIPREQ